MAPKPEPERRADAPPPQRASSLLAFLIIVSVVGLFALISNQFSNPAWKTITWDRFQQLSEGGHLAKLTLVSGDRIQGTVRDPADPLVAPLNLNEGRFTVVMLPSFNQEQTFREARASDQKVNAPKIADGSLEPLRITREEDQGGWVGPMLSTLIPTLLMLVIFFVFFMPKMREGMGGGMFGNYVRSPAKLYERGRARTTFADVAGMDGAKRELEEVVEFLKTPEKFLRLGAKIPRGVLLNGPPGTGKTLLARAVAGEAEVAFFSANGSEFIQMFVGVGASRVRDLFKTAREAAPCVVFIDEIDAVGRMRGSGVGGGSDEREQTLNQILGEMDGFSQNESIIVIAATNRMDVLDSALLRPGRFDRHITVDRPTWQGRLAILKIHTKDKPLADDVDLERVARRLTGMTGADLANLANEAALIAARGDNTRIDKKHFELALDRIQMGPLREEVISPKEKERTAYHEAGHALVCWYEPESDLPTKINIIPRGGALGVTIHQPDDDRYHYGYQFVWSRLVMTMGGRAADRLIHGEANAGAQSDLSQVTSLARRMVTQWGMSDKVGPMAVRSGGDSLFLGREIQEGRDYSESMAALVDSEIQRIVRAADARAFDILSEHADKLHLLAKTLLEREEMDREEIEKLLGFPPSRGATSES